MVIIFCDYQGLVKIQLHHEYVLPNQFISKNCLPQFKEFLKLTIYEFFPVLLMKLWEACYALVVVVVIVDYLFTDYPVILDIVQ